ncbi:MAG: hypothetical protein PSU94_10405 [Lacunisphaera sp.]|nr:hypothetical protein [Lacunisphaera sp.]
MNARPPAPPAVRRLTSERGSMLITAMLFCVGIAIVLGTYLSLSRTTLKVAHRTFFSNDAVNLAEAGVEEALYCFNQMAAGTAPATAWTGWTFASANAMRTLPTFNRDQNAVGVVKVYVKGYDGSDAAPYIMAQAVVTPFDGGAPVIRTLHLAMRRNAGTAGKGVVVFNGALSLANSTYADSYISNPTSSPTGPWSVYPAAGARSNASTVVLAGSTSIASGQVKGNLYLGSGVASPPASDYTGTLTTNYSATYPFPAFPTAAGVSQSYNLAAPIPAALPRAGDLPAADGRYYYFTTASVRSFAVTANTNVAIVGTAGMAVTSATLITLPTTSTLHVYVAGAVTLGTNVPLNAAGYAGALRIYTSTASNCTIANNCQLVAMFHAPNAAFSASGANVANRLSGQFIAKSISVASTQYLHYDESLPVYATYEMTRYMDFQSEADRATVAGLTGNYLR